MHAQERRQLRGSGLLRAASLPQPPLDVIAYRDLPIEHELRDVFHDERLADGFDAVGAALRGLLAHSFDRLHELVLERLLLRELVHLGRAFLGGAAALGGVADDGAVVEDGVVIGGQVRREVGETTALWKKTNFFQFES